MPIDDRYYNNLIRLPGKETKEKRTFRGALAKCKSYNLWNTPILYLLGK